MKKRNKKNNPKTKPLAASKPGRTPMKISSESLEQHQSHIMVRKQIKESYSPPITFGKPKEDIELAMDFCSNSIYDFIGSSSNSSLGLFGSAEFMGYASLSNLMQDGLLRIGPDIMAEEMTRKWVEFSFSGESEGDNKEKSTEIEEIESEFTRLDVRGIFRQAELFNEFFGGCLVYIDTGDSEDEDELKTPLALDDAKIKKGSLINLQVVEPVNVYPGTYNSDNPLKKDYFQPDTWFVLGKEVHKSRLLHFTANTPPLLLKPAYNFFGIPPVQMALDYVAKFTDSREAAARLLKKFSLTTLGTNMESILQGGTSSSLDLRAQLIAKYRDNESLILIDKETEEISQINTSLAGVIDITRQTLEFVASIWRIPNVKFFGISPGGMNATGESDFQNFYDHTNAEQERKFRKNVQTVLEIVQYNLGKKPDPNIVFKFVPLKEMSAKEIEENQKMKAERYEILETNGVISSLEIRTVIAKDPDSGFNDIEVDDVPEAPDNYEPGQDE